MTTHLDSPPRVAVLGAGLAGLAAAHLLASNLDVSIDIFESKSMPGGRANVEDEGEHCQRLFLHDYSRTLSLLEKIPFDSSRSVREILVPMRRFVSTPTLGWVEISHQYSVFAPEIGFMEKLRIAHAGRQSLLAARRIRQNTNFLGAPKNNYSLRSKIAVGRTFLRRQMAFALPGPTDRFLIDPWVSHLTRLGVNLHLSSPVNQLESGPGWIDVHSAQGVSRYRVVISSLFASSLGSLLDRSRIEHRIPDLEHANCPCFTINFDPREQSSRTNVPGLYSRAGLGLVVQPGARRCIVLCIRSARTDVDWVATQAKEILSLTHPASDIRIRGNSAPEEALFIGDHLPSHRILRSGSSIPLAIAGSWTRGSYPVDSGESAVRSAFRAVQKISNQIGLDRYGSRSEFR